MENLNNKNGEKYSEISNQDKDYAKQDPKEKGANTGDWEAQRDDNHYEDEDQDNNDNQGGAGSSGSAATNS